MTTTISKRGARAIADLDAGTILATVDIAVPPERVFRALTDSGEIVKWWGSPDMYRLTGWTADLRVGGKWKSTGVNAADGKPFSVGGEFVEIDPPRLLVHTWEPDWDPATAQPPTSPATTIRYQLDSISVGASEGTRVTMRHSGFGARRESCASHGHGWERVLGWLVGHLDPSSDTKTQAEAAAGPPPKHFFCRLIAPRPTFPFDMTPEEAAMMGEHGAYWREHLARGTAIVFGPVADPKGPWGLGVLKAPDLAAVQEFERNDPVIKSGRGFKYEILPMLAAVY